MIARLTQHAEANPGHDAVVTSAYTLSYAELRRLVSIQAKRLQQAGITSESVVGIKCSDDTKHLLLCLAAMHLGASSCTVPTHDPEAAQQAVIDYCGVSVVLDDEIAVEPSSAGQDDALAFSQTPAANAQLYFATSGTTGEAKFVIHHDSDLVAQAHRHVESTNERFACLASMEHNFVKRHRLYCVAAGASNVFLDAPPELLVSQCQSLEVNVLHVSAFQAQELLVTPNVSQLASIRLKLGGSHVPIALRQQLRDSITQNLQAGYGTTETGAIGFTDPADTGAGESVGRPLPGIEIQAVSEDRQPLKSGERGELAIRCDGMFRGYLAKSELSAKRLVDGWFYSGDVGYLDEQQRIHLCGRADDMFVFNSINIYPQDIESQVRQFPGVKDAAVLAKPSAVHGHIPVALVAFEAGMEADLAALNQHVRKQVGVRCPRQFCQVDAVPRNASGKILRTDAMRLLTSNEHIRSDIVRTLNSGEDQRIKVSLAKAFEKGDSEAALSDIDLDSLARMDLMVMLEVGYGKVIAPEAFAEFTSLAEIAAWAQTESSADDFETNNSHDATYADEDSPYVVRFFRRVFHYCHTAAEFNKALATLDHRLTPGEFECLRTTHRAGGLIPAAAAQKFHAALGDWLKRNSRMIADSGKNQIEPFCAQRLLPTVTHFVGTGQEAEKTLLVCFPGAGDRQLLMPNAVLLQHTDAARYDLLVIGEPLKKGYRFGVPSLGSNVTEVVESIRGLGIAEKYRSVRTLGVSAGGHAAVIAAFRLGAEMGMSVGGRFHSERYPHRILDRVIRIWRAVRNGQCSRVVMAYAADKTRDRNFARIVGRMTGGNLFGVEFAGAEVGHLIFERLVERGELAPYLARTIFADMDDDFIATKRASVILSLPQNTVR